MRNVTVAATQMACDWDRDGNIARAEALVVEAAEQGANIILLQELFETPYFCQEQDARHFDLARPLDGNPLIGHFSLLARKLGVVLPVSFFERAGQAYFNSMLVIDADGEPVDHYRKMHIPDGPGYQEKFYFAPGDTGFITCETRFGRIGVGICWDQWFPECARAMALKGAELLFYPTAIGSEPHDPTIDSRQHWMRVMQGHAGANLMPVIASNRIGSEQTADSEITFYGSSFIAGAHGEMLELATRDQQQVLLHSFDLDALGEQRRAWGVFRDRRPEYYLPLLGLDGHGR